MSDAADRELLARAAAGEARAFEELAETHGGALARLLARMCPSAAEAEDALQDGLLQAWRFAGSFEGASSVRTWLFGIAMNACRHRVRRRAGEPAAHDPLEKGAGAPAPGAPPDRAASASELSRVLEEVLAQMPAEAREVLLLRDVEGLDGPGAARALGIGVPAMKSRLHRARLELKERLEARLGHAVEEEL